MSTQKLAVSAWALAAWCTAFSSSSVHASAPSTTTCVFEKYAPVAVVPYSYDAYLAYGSFSFLRGAQLYVPARKGLTREWLEASVQRALQLGVQSGGRLSERSGLPCSPYVENVQVSVMSSGPGFWVQLIGSDEASATELLDWARSIVEQRQWGSATTTARRR